MVRWREKQLIGFSVWNMGEMERGLRLGANLVEVKLEGFNKEIPLYVYRDRVFLPNKDNVRKVTELVGNAVVNLHLPIEDRIDIDQERGLNPAIFEHHCILLQRFEMLGALYPTTGFGRVVTMHPPLVSANGETLIEEKLALANAKIFFDQLDVMRLKNWHINLIGLENTTDIKAKAGNLGYLPGHFKSMLKDTRTIGLTIDTGHRRLTKDFRIRDFLSLGMPVNNFHFHGNSGEFNPDNWDDDQHQLPNEENVTGYRNYLRYFRRHRPPIVLEISHLERYSDSVLREALEELHTKIK